MKLEELEGIVEFVDDESKIVIVHKPPGDQEVRRHYPGHWKCGRCEATFDSEKTPVTCLNELCGRKGPFIALTPPVPSKIPWPLPGLPIACDHDDILQQIANFIEENVELPDERLYEVLASWVMASWVWETVSDSCPYLFFLGPKESGKSWAQDVLKLIAYRGVKSASFTPAALVRRVDRNHCTVMLDELESQLNMRTESGAMLNGILNAGYRKGDIYERCRSESNELDTFYPYGFKSLAATRGFLPTLESRCIIINMEAAEKNIPQRIDTKRAKELRSMLLHFRLEELEKISPVAWSGDVGMQISGRLIEMFTPLVTIAHFFHDTVSPLLELLKDVQTSRLRAERESFEADVIGVIASAEDDVVYFAEIANHIADTKPQKIGYCLKKLGITRRRDTSGTCVSKSENAARLKKLCKRYQI